MANPPAGLDRRRFVGAAAVMTGGLLVPVTSAAATATTTQTRLRLRLPKPTGPHEIGRASLHLVDPNRQDPWWSEPRPRELMIDLWYPARRSRSHGLAPWMSPGVLGYFVSQHEAFLSRSPDTPSGEDPVPLDVSLDDVEFPVTHARRGVPADTSTGPLPVVIFAPGFGGNREFGTALVEDLASHGYVVVTVGHTYEAGQVEFPDGRIERHRPRREPEVPRRYGPPAWGRATRAGQNWPSWQPARTPTRDTHRSRPACEEGSTWPGSACSGTRSAGPPPPPRWPETSGSSSGSTWTAASSSRTWIRRRRSRESWKRRLVDSMHATFTDNEWIISQLAAAGILPFSAPWIGQLNPNRAITAQRAYILATFDQWLRDRPSPLRDTPPAPPTPKSTSSPAIESPRSNER